MRLIGSKRAVRSPEFHKKKEIQKWVKVSAFVLLILLLVVAPVMILRNKNLLIAKVDVVGNSVTKSEDIQDLVTQKLTGKYAWLIPKSSSFLYSASRIESNLLNSIPRLASASVNLSGRTTLSVLVEERTPYALYCKDVSDPESPAKCFLLDNTGYIFSEAPSFSGGVYFIYTSDPSFETPQRSSFLFVDEFKKTDTFVKNISKLHLDPKILTKRGDEYELSLSSGTIVKWRSAQNLDTLYTNLSSLLTNSTFKLSDVPNLSYIDLRFDNKVFYKFKNEQ